MQPITAKSAGFAQCHDCHKLLQYSPNGECQFCPRCGARVEQRRHASIAKTWALIITALIFLVPANLYPIMTVIYFGEGEPSTIIDGVILLVHIDMIPVAIIIFIASIAVPFLKISGIILLLLSVQFKRPANARQRTMLYRFVEWIGRWSMLDIFVIAILMKLVEMGSIAEIQGNIAAFFFGMSVIFTMMSAFAFDPRLIWDHTANQGDKNGRFQAE